MGRAIGGAVVGYIVMFAVIFVLMTVTWFVLGESGAFKPGVWEVSTTWVSVALVVAFLAAFVGGKAAQAIGRAPITGSIYAGLVFVLGVLMSIPILTGSMPQGPLPRPDELPMFQALSLARPPAWAGIVQPIVGAIGGLLGARRRGV